MSPAFVHPPGCGVAGCPICAAEKPPPPSELPLAFSREPIIGYRIWRVDDVLVSGSSPEPRLCSVGVDAFWEAGKPTVANCRVTRFITAPGSPSMKHRSPWSGCSCGIWALKSRADAEATLGEYRRRDGLATWVVGAVRLWGRVIDCERGYRAELAYPVSLEVGGDNAPDVAEQLAAAYRVPARTIDLPALPDPSTDPWLMLNATTAQMQAQLRAMQASTKLMLFEPPKSTLALRHRVAIGVAAAVLVNGLYWLIAWAT